ncbi:hypothetical protein ACFQJC_05975 [Haloferax namakaokahaiae]|uniref:DUF7847 domain-containing protein n=1 Tax=Haloferax namakaokahaiae TaxID=1748331 RepID=A0ABD5ZDI7_9EURY
MAVGTALRRVPAALARNPLLIVLFGLFGLLQAIQVLTQQINPIVGLAISGVMILVYLFGLPFLQGGVIKMADEALDGTTSLASFVAAGKENYVSLLGATLAVFGGLMVLGIIINVVVFAGIFVVSTGMQSTVGLVIVGAIGLLLGLLYLAFAFVIQFYPQEIVLNDAGALDSLKQSYHLVRAHVVSSAGFLVIAMVAGGLIGVVVGLLSSVLLPPTGMGVPGLPQGGVLSMVGYAVVSVLAMALGGSTFSLFAVAFYRELRGPIAADAPMASA